MKPSRTAIAVAVALVLGACTALARDSSYVDSSTIREVQQTLTHRGFRTGPVDGVMGAATRSAVKQFQQSENLEATGQLNRQTLVALGLQPDPAAVRPVRIYGAGTIRKVQQTLNNRGFDAGAVDGSMTPRTQAAVRDFQKSENLEPTGQLNEKTLAALGMPDEPTVVAERRTPIFITPPASPTVRRVQQALNARGFQAGPPDGVLGPATESALRNFQATERLEATGRLNRATLDALGVPAG